MSSLAGAARGAAAAFHRALADPIASSSLARKPTSELLRAYVVLRLCQVPSLVSQSERLLKLATRTPITDIPTRAMLRATLYKQFCAGETVEASLRVLSKLHAEGMGGILDCAIEADAPASSSSATKCSSLVEAKAAENMTRLLESIRITHLASQTLPDKQHSPVFSAVKLTALANPTHLREAARMISESASPPSGGGCLPPMHKAMAAAPEEAWALLKPLQERLEALAEASLASRVHLLVDAEQTYFQPAIDAVTCRVMHKYNHRTHRTVYNTYQAYLVGTEERLAADLQWARNNGVQMGVKLVRGAYMVSERELAAAGGYISPVHATVHETHKCYDQALALALHQVATNTGVGLVIATHNKDSIDLAVDCMAQDGLLERSGDVQFAQLYGMADHLSGVLARHNFQVLKYLPYGPIREVLPYLVRRAQENNALLGNTASHLLVLQNELLRRWRGHAAAASD